MLITTCSTDSHHDEVDYLSPTSCGIRATIIDFGLSRLDIPSKGPVWTALPMEVFEGVGDQWDVYRSMRERVEDWEAFHPVTNILVRLTPWLLVREADRPRSGYDISSPTSSTRKACADLDQRV